MTTKIADEFAAIRQRMREVNGEKELMPQVRALSVFPKGGSIDFASLPASRVVNRGAAQQEQSSDAVNPAPSMAEIIGAIAVAESLGFAGGGRPSSRSWLGDSPRELFLPLSSQYLIEAPEVPKTNDAEVARLVRELETQMADFVDQMHAAQKRADERFSQIEKRIKEHGEEMGRAFREILAMVLALKRVSP